VSSGGSTTTNDRLTVFVEEAGAMLGISRAHAYELVRRGVLPKLQLGRRADVERIDRELRSARLGDRFDQLERQPPSRSLGRAPLGR